MSNLTDREYQFWMTRHINREHCWIVLARIGEMISHEGRKIYHDNEELSAEFELELKQDTLEYVFIADMNNKSMLVFATDKGGNYYVIRNSFNTKTKQLDSKIHIASTFKGGLALLTKQELKRYGIKSTPSLSTNDSDELKDTVCVDFIHQNAEQQKDLWRKFVRGAKDQKLDLSGFQTVEHDILVSAKPNKKINTLILYQNNRITTFEWVAKIIPNVRTISVWLSNTFNDDVVKNLVDNVPLIQEFEAHHCYAVTGRCLIDLLRLKLLNKLMLDNATLKCQENTFGTVIKDDEWSGIMCESLSLALINSDNFTPDFADYLLKSCPNMAHLVISDKVLEKLHQSTLSGHEKDEIVFQSFHDKGRGFKRFKTVKFINLIRNKVNPKPFSDSMLKIIEAKRQLKKNEQLSDSTNNESHNKEERHAATNTGNHSTSATYDAGTTQSSNAS